MSENEDVILTTDQSTAALAISLWFEENSQPTFTLAGYAGTGKTFLINYIIHNMLKLKENEIAFTAPTGKAATVLSQRGCLGATTVHKLIYRKEEKSSEEEINGKKIIRKEISFIKVKSLPSSIKLIIVDEASMLSEKIKDDLESFKIPIIYLGDKGQLKPVDGTSSVLDNPDINLTEIVRQSEGDPIVWWATHIRNGGELVPGDYGNVKIYHKELLYPYQINEIFLDADQIICGTNKTRDYINDLMSRLYCKNPKGLQDGEKVICELNNWDIPLDKDEKYSLVNGTIGDVKNIEVIDKELNLALLDFKPDFLDSTVENILFDMGRFTNSQYTYEKCTHIGIDLDGEMKIIENLSPQQPDESTSEFKKRATEYALERRRLEEIHMINMFSKAYAITVYKSQGSEWENVVLYIPDAKYFKDQLKEFLYTGITRAKKKLTIIY